MHPLHITKVAVGCASPDVLAERLSSRAADGEVDIFTRYRPKRADELIGGSLFWIIKHRLVLRQRIVGFAEADAEPGKGKRCVIRVEERLVPVRALPKRAHQGWRYLAGSDAPADFDDADAGNGLALLPRHIADELFALALL